MNNNFREGLNALREISDPEKMKMALERITGKKLADYEGIDALVGALMGYYNDEVKKKVSKNGDTMAGTLSIKHPAWSEVKFLSNNGTEIGVVGGGENSVYLRVGATDYRSIRLYNDGRAEYPATNLKTPYKEVVGAINDMFDNSWKINPKPIGDADTTTDLNNIYIAGFYRSSSGTSKFINTPVQIGAFELIVTGIQPYMLAYTTQLLKDHDTNRIWIRTQRSYAGQPASWTAWEELTNKISKSGDTMNGGLTLLQRNDTPQIIGNRSDDSNDLNTRYIQTAMGISYTGTVSYGKLTNAFPTTDNANGILTFNTHPGDYGHQIALTGKGIYDRINHGGNHKPWKKIAYDNDYTYIGAAYSVGQKVPVGDYSEYLIYMRYSSSSLIATYHLTKQFIIDPNTLKNFICWGTTVIEGEFAVENGYFVLKDIGAGSDGGIYVWAK